MFREWLISVLVCWVTILITKVYLIENATLMAFLIATALVSLIIGTVAWFIWLLIKIIIDEGM